MFSGGKIGCMLWLLYSQETVCRPIVYTEKVGDQVRVRSEIPSSLYWYIDGNENERGH